MKTKFKMCSLMKKHCNEILKWGCKGRRIYIPCKFDIIDEGIGGGILILIKWERYSNTCLKPEKRTIRECLIGFADNFEEFS